MVLFPSGQAVADSLRFLWSLKTRSIIIQDVVVRIEDKGRNSQKDSALHSKRAGEAGPDKLDGAITYFNQQDITGSLSVY